MRYSLREKGLEGGHKMRAEVVAELKRIVGEQYVVTSFEDLVCYQYDASFVHPGEEDFPGAVVLPGSTEEVAAVLKLANRERIPVIPRGAGSNVTGGSLPAGECIILVMRRMNRILEIDTKNLIAVVEPGVITAQLQQEVEKYGLFYPPDPASLAYSTMGGNVAECAGGPRGVKYGVTRDYVLGLEVVLADGTVITTGGRCIKNVTGYNLTQLFVGSEGTLGVITKIIVRLLPLPEAKKTMMVIFPEVEQAGEAVAAIIAGGIIPATLEFLDNVYIRMIEDYARVGLPVEAGALLLIEVDGDREVLDKQVRRIEEVCRLSGAIEVRVAATQAEAEELWRARRSAFPAVSRARPTIIGEDATVPRSEIPKLVRHIHEVAAKYNLTIAIVGHAGDGNLHATILADERNTEEMERVHKAAEEIFRKTLELRGTLSGEHGIGRAKSAYLKWQLGEEGLAVQRRIKAALDPNNILNPGLMFEE